MYLINASSNSLSRDEKVVYKCILHHFFGHNFNFLRSPKTIFVGCPEKFNPQGFFYSLDNLSKELGSKHSTR